LHQKKRQRKKPKKREKKSILSFQRDFLTGKRRNLEGPGEGEVAAEATLLGKKRKRGAPGGRR